MKEALLGIILSAFLVSCATAPVESEAPNCVTEDMMQTKAEEAFGKTLNVVKLEGEKADEFYSKTGGERSLEQVDAVTIFFYNSAQDGDVAIVLILHDGCAIDYAVAPAEIIMRFLAMVGMRAT